MSDTHQEELSDSPFIANFGWNLAESDGVSVLPADGHWYLFVMKINGEARLAIGGPLTKVMYLPYIAGTEWFGIRFRLGTYMPHLPTGNLLDNVTFLPSASSKSFYLQGSVWEYPNYDNADTFVNRLVRNDLLVRDPVVNGVLQDQPQDFSIRTIRRRFLHVTGVTHSTIRQIERARKALALLQSGASILDTVHETGYFDQPHLTKSLKYLMGVTPAQIARATNAG